MSIQKKSLISTLKTTKKANAAKGNVEAAPASGKMANKIAVKMLVRTAGKAAAKPAAHFLSRTD